MRRLSSLSLLLIGLLVFLGGCSQGSFLSRGLSDLGAYFNSYYNAQKSFSEAVAAYEVSEQPVDPTRFLPLFHAPEQAGNQSAFNSTIDKSADVLREHPESHFVDDALMLIGKSYFYLQNYVAAQQKFREIINLSSPLEGEARYWLARSLTASRAYEDALLSVQESLLLEEELDERWLGRLHLVLGTLHVEREQWEEAAEQVQLGLETTRDNALRARAWYLLGQIREQLGRYDEAVAAYRQSVGERPPFELTYAARLAAVRVEGLHGSAADALDQLASMQGDDKFYAKRAELTYLEGRLLQEQAKIDEAMDTYTELLYGEGASVQGVRGRIHYALGLLHRDVKNDFVQAAAHFDTAATALPAIDDEIIYAPAAITNATTVDEAFGSFAEVMTNLNRMDSLLALGALDDEAFQEAILELQKQRAAELEAQREAAAREARQQQFGDQIFTGNNNQSVENREAPSAESGFLYHKEPLRVQENLREFFDQWGERPLVPNWRRRAAIESGGARGSGEGAASAQDILAEVSKQRLPAIDVSAVPRDSVSRHAMLAERALARYEMGNVLFMQLAMPDSAAAWYRMVVEEDEGQEIVPRAYYALAQVHQARGQPDEADRLYELILARFPQSSLAARVRTQQQSLTVSAADDSLQRAHAAYVKASQLWGSGAYDAALDSMIAVAARHAGTPVAPQALLAAGTLYLEWTQNDSLALERPIELSLPDSLLAKLGLAPDRLSADTLVADDSLDVTGLADSLVAMADTVGVNSLNVSAADSLGLNVVSSDTSFAGSRVAVRDSSTATIGTLLAALTARYPDSPHAAKAERMLAVIREITAPPVVPADSTIEMPAADSTGAALLPPTADSTATDSIGLPRRRLDRKPADSTFQEVKLPRLEDRKLPADSIIQEGELPRLDNRKLPADSTIQRGKLPRLDDRKLPANSPADSTGKAIRRLPPPAAQDSTRKVLR